MKFNMELTIDDKIFDNPQVVPYNVVGSALKRASNIMDAAGGVLDVGIYRVEWGVTEQAVVPQKEEAPVSSGEDKTEAPNGGEGDV